MKVGKWAIALGILLGMMSRTPSSDALTFVTPDMVGTKVKLERIPGAPGGANGGGEFWMSWEGNGFATFCLEKNEYFTSGGSYTIHSISKYAVGGGKGGNIGPQGDPIEKETASIYYNYVSGGLTGFDGADEDALANAVQQAIWYLEGELGDTKLEDLPLLVQNLIKAAQQNELGAIPPNIEVVAINLMECNRITGKCVHKQSQLGLMQTTAVPEASTVLLLGAGLIAVAVSGRHWRRKTL